MPKTEDELWKEYKRTKNLKIREELILKYASTVKYIAGKIAINTPPQVEFDDLVSYGILGLIDAIEKYNYGQGITFKTYATTRIKGAIIDELRELDWIPRSLRKKARQLEKAYAEVEYKYGRSATDKEIAEFLEITEEELSRLILDVSGVSLISLDDVWYLNDAEKKGYTVVDAPTIISTHMQEIIRKNAPDLISRQDVQSLMDSLKQTHPTVVAELIPGQLSLGEVQKVLHSLLQEGLSIRDLLTITETLADWAPKTKDIGFLTEQVRMSLSRQIMRQYLSKDGILLAITLHPKLENEMGDNIRQTSEGEQLILDPARLQKITQAVHEEIKRNIREVPIILCSPRIRRHFKNLIMRTLPQIGVLSYNEVTSDVDVRSVGMVDVS